MAKRSGFDSGEMIAEDPKTKRILEIVKRVAPSDASIMISGESGTGKEVLERQFMNARIEKTNLLLR